MQTILLTNILVEDRLRKDLGNIDELAEAITEHGLIQPIVLTLQPDGVHKLVAGGRRFTALQSLGHKEVFHGVTCDPLRPGFVYASELPAEVQREIELMENIQRKDMTWQEECHACVEIHNLYIRKAAGAWSQLQTAERIACIEIHNLYIRKAGGQWSQIQTAERINRSRAYISYCLDLVDLVDKEPFLSCATMSDAIKLRAQQRMDEALREQLRRSKVASAIVAQQQAILSNPMPCVSCEGTGKYYKTGEPCRSCNGTGLVETYDKNAPLSWETADSAPLIIDVFKTLLHGDSVYEVMTQMPSASIDHIITDPPYAIDMANLQQSQHVMDVSRVADTHQVAPNLQMLYDAIPVMFRILKDTSYCLLCCDIMNWQFLYDRAIDVGFKVQRWPIYWKKLHQCKNEAATVNFTKDIEFVMVCRKSSGTLPTPVGTCGVATAKTDHDSNPFAKPFEFWKFLIEGVSLQNQVILDPFAGEGSCPLSCLQLGRRPLAIEKDETHYAFLVQKYKEYFTSKLKNVEFV